MSFFPLCAVALAACVVSPAPMAASTSRLNVQQGPLQLCCAQPPTGYQRDGMCRAISADAGTHTVCAVVTAEFLAFTASRGNDLGTPRPEYGFGGLKPGDRWCLCALRWREALQAQVAPPVILAATDVRTLDFVDLGSLEAHAYRP